MKPLLFAIIATLGIATLHAAEPQQHSVATLPASVVKTEPQAGMTDVDPSITEIKVTYSKKMADRTWSWGQISDETFPKTAGKPHYLQDGKTCVLPVKLEPGHTYVLELNSFKGKFNNFKDENRQPATRYLLVFETRK
jgi:RNA polymerase sigma-70 factor (ECF subfamily)